MTLTETLQAEAASDLPRVDSRISRSGSWAPGMEEPGQKKEGNYSNSKHLQLQTFLQQV